MTDWMIVYLVEWSTDDRGLIDWRIDRLIHSFVNLFNHVFICFCLFLCHRLQCVCFFSGGSLSKQGNEICRLKSLYIALATFDIDFTLRKWCYVLQAKSVYSASFVTMGSAFFFSYRILAWNKTLHPTGCFKFTRKAYSCFVVKSWWCCVTVLFYHWLEYMSARYTYALLMDR